MQLPHSSWGSATRSQTWTGDREEGVQRLAFKKSGSKGVLGTQHTGFQAPVADLRWPKPWPLGLGPAECVSGPRP